MLALSSATMAAIAKNLHHQIDFIEIIVDKTNPDKDVRFCSQVYNMDAGSKTWYGAGGLLTIGRMSQTSEAKSNNIDITLDGFNEEVLTLLTNNEVVGCIINIYKGFLDTSTGALVEGSPFQRWSGFVVNYAHQITYDEDGSGTVAVSISCESLLSTILGTKNARTTDDTSFSYANNGDRSMAYVAALSQWAPEFGKKRENSVG